MQQAPGWPSKFWPAVNTRSHARLSWPGACSTRLDAKRARWRRPVADPALRRLGAPVPGLSTPVCKGNDAHFGVVVREDNAVGEALEDQPPVLVIADPAGQLVRRFEDALETRSRQLEKLSAQTFAAFLVPLHRVRQLRLGTRQQVKGSRHRWAKRARRRPYASFHGTGGSAPESAAATRASHS